MLLSNVRTLKITARDLGLKGYSKLNKSELIEHLKPYEEQIKRLPLLKKPKRVNMMDEPVPEIKVPILKPIQFTAKSNVKSLKSLADKAAKPIIKNINKFADWLYSYVPEPVRNITNEKVNKLKNRRNQIFKRLKTEFKIEEKEMALKGYLKSYRINGVSGYDPKKFISSIKPKVLDFIKQQKKPIKLKFVFTCSFQKENPATGQIDIRTGHFHSLAEKIIELSDLSDILNTMTGIILEKIQQFQNNGSGWVFENVEYFDINTDPFEPLSGSSYISLPKNLEDKKAIINVRNENDHECLKLAITSAIYQREKHPERLIKEMRNNSQNFNWDGINFPVSIKQIDKFERQNNYAINVFGYEDSKVYPLRLSKKDSQVVDLLLITAGPTNHYCWIKNKNRSFSRQVSKTGHAKFFCDRCINHFPNGTALKNNLEYCSSHDAVRIEFPKPKKDEEKAFLKFKNHKKKMRVPFVIYADFECFTKKISTCSPDGSKSYTKQFQRHKPSRYCYLIKCFDDNLFAPILDKYTAQSPDEDISQRFISSLENSIKDIFEKFKYKKNLKWTKKDKKAYKASTYCHICEGEQLNDKVADHCHLTGKFHGAAHNKCNLEYRIPKFFPVIFLNLAGYDAHLFVKNLGVTEGKINCIPKNEENYISFTKEIEVDNKTKTISVKHELRFIDSFKIMATSLVSLANNLPDNTFNNLSYFFEEQAKLKLLKKKGVYPYDYMDCFERLSQTTSPPIESFYSELNKSGISEDNSTHAQNVWETFEMETLQDYHDLYLKTDVLLLADVFENFRDVCQENYGLDPAWYYTAPGLAWDAALKVTKVELELLADPDMLLMIEKGIRGGLSMISTRYGKANNPYMGDSYDPNQPTKYISY